MYSGQYSRYRRRRHGSSSGDLWPYRFIAFAQNHDQVGNRLRGERLSHLTSLAGLKVAAAAVILAPFTPLLFMGEEYGETAPFLYFVSHTDPDLIEAVRRGRAREFAAFGWDEEPPDPQSIDTFQRSRPNAALARQEPHQALWRYYQELINIRREMLDLINLGGYSPEVTVNHEQAVLSLQYGSSDWHYCIFLCFSDRPEVITLPPGTGTWCLRLDTAATRWAGPGTTLPETLEPESALTLASISCVVLSREKE